MMFCKKICVKKGKGKRRRKTKTSSSVPAPVLHPETGAGKGT